MKYYEFKDNLPPVQVAGGSVHSFVMEGMDDTICVFHQMKNHIQIDYVTKDEHIVYISSFIRDFEEIGIISNILKSDNPNPNAVIIPLSIRVMNHIPLSTRIMNHIHRVILGDLCLTRIGDDIGVSIEDKYSLEHQRIRCHFTSIKPLPDRCDCKIYDHEIRVLDKPPAGKWKLSYEKFDCPWIQIYMHYNEDIELKVENKARCNIFNFTMTPLTPCDKSEYEKLKKFFDESFEYSKMEFKMVNKSDMFDKNVFVNCRFRFDKDRDCYLFMRGCRHGEIRFVYTQVTFVEMICGTFESSTKEIV